VEHDENGNPQNNVWVKVNLTANQPLEFYVYYGSSTAPSYSDGDAVFEFFDDFDGSSLDTGKWSLKRWYGSGSYYADVSNSIVKIHGDSDTTYGIISKWFGNLPFVVEGMWKQVSGSEMWNAVTHLSEGGDNLLRVGYASNRFLYQKRNGDGTYYTYEQISRTPPSSFINFKWIITSTNSYYFENMQQINTVTTQDKYSSENLYLQLYGWDGSYFDYDYIFKGNFVNYQGVISVNTCVNLLF